MIAETNNWLWVISFQLTLIIGLLGLLGIIAWRM
jgi:hypothetical protein